MPTTPDDLAPLFPTADDRGVVFRQGVILTWDEQTGDNTVDVGGSVQTNVPMLNSSGVVNLAVGDVVGLLAFKSQMFILGKIITPGAADFAAGALGFTAAGEGNITDGHGVNVKGAGQPIKTSVRYVTPSWATRILVSATVFVSAQNQRASTDFLRCAIGFDVDDAGSGDPQGTFTEVDPGRWGNVGGGAQQVITAAPGSHTLDVEAWVWSDGGDWGHAAANATHLNSFVTYARD